MAVWTVLTRLVHADSMPRWQVGPRWGQVGPGWGQVVRSWANVNPRWAKLGRVEPECGAGFARGKPRWANWQPKMDPRWLKFPKGNSPLLTPVVSFMKSTLSWDELHFLEYLY